MSACHAMSTVMSMMGSAAPAPAENMGPHTPAPQNEHLLRRVPRTRHKTGFSTCATFLFICGRPTVGFAVTELICFPAGFPPDAASYRLTRAPYR